MGEISFYKSKKKKRKKIYSSSEAIHQFKAFTLILEDDSKHDIFNLTGEQANKLFSKRESAGGKRKRPTKRRRSTKRRRPTKRRKSTKRRAGKSSRTR